MYFIILFSGNDNSVLKKNTFSESIIFSDKHACNRYYKNVLISSKPSINLLKNASTMESCEKTDKNYLCNLLEILFSFSPLIGLFEISN